VRALASGAVGGTPMLASGGGDGTVRIWDPSAGRIVRSVRTDHDGAVAAVALARMHGRSVIITGGDDGTVRMWDSRDGRQIGAHALFPWPVGPLAWTESGILVVAVGSELVAIKLV
jgi:WD40 repeat protein